MVRELETPTKGATPEARVVVEQRASVPTAPVVPKKKRNLAIGIAFGAMLGVALALVRDQFDNTIKTQEALEDVTGTGVVGYIPFDKKLAGDHTIAFDTDISGIAEAFRKLRTNLQFLAVDNPPRLIVVTSSSPSEGKSTTAINIALALAEADHNVVLVDGDLRRPRLAKYLDLVGSVGFSSVISGGASLDDVLQATKFPRVTVLAAGTIPPNPSELLGSMATKKMFNDLRAKYDYVIVDSSPLLAVTDGAIIAANSDGAIMAVRAGKTKRDHLAYAIGMLRDVDAKLLGAVLTMLPTRGSSSYSYSYYYSDSYSDSHGDKAKVQTAVTPPPSIHSSGTDKQTPDPLAVAQQTEN
jgi:receptor protein-tyrosine kinase